VAKKNHVGLSIGTCADEFPKALIDYGIILKN